MGGATDGNGEQQGEKEGMGVIGVLKAKSFFWQLWARIPVLLNMVKGSLYS